MMEPRADLLEFAELLQVWMEEHGLTIETSGIMVGDAPRTLPELVRVYFEDATMKMEDEKCG